MEQTVYGDLLFFVNFCMDFQCLFLVARLLRRPFAVRRAVLFSALGALYACTALFVSVPGAVAFVMDLAVCFLMCLGVFVGTGRGFLRFLVPFSLYFGVSFAMGGMISGLSTLLAKLELPLAGGSTDSSVLFFLLAALGGALTFLWGRLCQRRGRGERLRVTLRLQGKELCVEGIVDTANLLRDPLGGRPVAILDQRLAREWLPAPLRLAAEGGGDVTALPAEMARRVRMIPTRTVAGQGMLLAVAPDAAVLEGDRGARHVELLVAPAPISTGERGINILLPAAILTE